MLNLIDKCPNVRQQLNGKLVASLEKFLRIHSCSDTGRSAGQYDCAGRQGGALGEEAD